MNSTQKTKSAAAELTSNTPLRVAWLQHVPFEGAGAINAWMQNRGHKFQQVMLWRGQPLPNKDAIDWLIVMGGPMNVDDVDRYPWLLPERAFIRTCIQAGIPVLGVCLGAQLLARAAGALVAPGPSEEIGWFPVQCTAAGARLFGAHTPLVFHWHGDQLELPAGALRLASTALCPNQAFSLGNSLGLQFHLETTPDTAQALIDHCPWQPGATAQSAEQMMADPEQFKALNALLSRVLAWQEPTHRTSVI